MQDREKVIKGVECCANVNSCSECPYDELGDTWLDCVPKLMQDVLTLLKEQELKSPCSDCQEFVCDGCKYADGR